MSARQAADDVKRIAIVASYAPSLLLFRGGLIGDMLARGHRVICFAPDFDDETRQAVHALGAECQDYPLARTGLNPLADLKAQRALVRAFRAIRPHVVMGYTAKPAIYASLAAARIGVEHIVPMITGLGYAFLEGQGRKAAIVQRLLKRLYRKALRRSHAVIFHNKDDYRVLADMRVIAPTLPVHIVNGSGVDLERFATMPLPPLTDGNGLVFLMIARLVRYKGIFEFVDAARAVKAKAPAARFVIVGPEESGPAGFPVEQLREYEDVVEYLGSHVDVRPALGKCHVYVLPSYGEGMPRTVLEALAVGRPVITTNARGCRETVDERVNGCLVPIGDARALAEAMESFLHRPDLIPAMARASRQKAERVFDERLVNRMMLQVLGLQQNDHNL